METTKPPKERANKLYIKFKSPLSPQSLTILAADSTFTGRFSVVDVFKHNENVIGIHTIDSDKVDYILNIEGIEAFSQFGKDSEVKKKLGLFTKGFLSRLGRGTSDYLLDDTTRHEIIDLDLINLLKPGLIENLKRVFENKGYDEPSIVVMRILAKKKNKLVKNIQFWYPDQKYEEKKRAVIEANTDLLKEILEHLK